MRERHEVKKSKRTKSERGREPQKLKQNQMRIVQSEQLCIATAVMCSYMVWGAVFGARVVGVVSETDV